MSALAFLWPSIREKFVCFFFFCKLSPRFIKSIIVITMNVSEYQEKELLAFSSFRFVDLHRFLTQRFG